MAGYFMFNSTPRDSRDGRIHWQALAAGLLVFCLSWLAVGSTSFGSTSHEADNRIDTASPSYEPAPQHMSDRLSSSLAITGTERAFTLTVLSTNDTWGYLDPCG